MSARLIRARKLSQELSSLNAAALRVLLQDAEPLGVGIGGSTSKTTVNGLPVFIKRLPLADYPSGEVLGTADLKRLPLVSHYGIGSPGFGAGRELTAHRIVSDWVFENSAQCFPLLLGSCVMEVKTEIDVTEFDGADAARKWGDDWTRIEQQLAQIHRSTHSLVLFLEYVPQTLEQWLRQSLADNDAGRVLALVWEQLCRATAWMEQQQFIHFDLHPGNILVQDEQLLLTDLGLSMHSSFDLDAEERDFLNSHLGFDRDSALMYLTHWILFELGIVSRVDRMRWLAEVAADPEAGAADLVRRRLQNSATLLVSQAATTLRLSQMFDSLMQDIRSPSYPDCL